MFVIINAVKSIARSKGRNILIGIIVLAIAASSCVALAIRNAAREAEEAGVDAINITGAITLDNTKLMEAAQNTGTGDTPNMESMREMMAEYQSLGLDELLPYADSAYAKDFYYTGSTSLNATDPLEPYSTESSSGDENNTSNSMGGQGRQGQMGGGFVMGGNIMTMGDFTVTGYSAEAAMTKFINGTSKITEGEMFDIESSEMTCLISDLLAAFNELSVGDSITLENPNGEEETYTLTIAGIFNDSSSEGTSTPRFSTSMDPANQIYISYSALEAIRANSESVATTETDDNGNESTTALSEQFSGTFVFAGQEEYEAFEAELRERGLSEYYTLTSSDINSYEASLVPLQNLSKFAMTLLIVVLSIGAVILIVINVFNIRERKYEVGVLTAIGIKKQKVALQFVAELLCVTLLAIILGSGVGAAVSFPVAENLLESQIEQMSVQNENQNQSFGRQGMENGENRTGGRFTTGAAGGSGPMMSIFGGTQGEVSYLDKINATVDFTILGQLILIGVALTLISSLAAVIFVMRYEPLKILANRT